MDKLLYEINTIDFINKNKILNQLDNIQNLKCIAQQTNDYHNIIAFCHEFYLLLCQLNKFKLTDNLNQLYKLYNSGMDENTSNIYFKLATSELYYLKVIITDHQINTDYT